jgi:hypothetical protein
MDFISDDDDDVLVALAMGHNLQLLFAVCC